MFQLEQPATFEQVIKKSRFLAIAVPVASEGEAKDAIALQSVTDATHNCWAWRIGSAYRFSDDGEPSGTAGKPILAAMDGQSLDKAVVIVTRWFGGILLGSGGLVRAYGGTAAACLRGAPLIEVKPSLMGAVSIEFSDLARTKARLQSIEDVKITEEVFTDTGAELRIQIPEGEQDIISRLISDLTSGRSELSLD